jgi:hypothetical protein
VLNLDNCSPGYASQRHIVAGAVSNRKSSLRVLTGFSLSRKFLDCAIPGWAIHAVSHALPPSLTMKGIAMTLGMPRLPMEWSNDQVLGFFRHMWQQWLLKSRNGNQATESIVRGPAPPAAVAAAAKIAFSAMGSTPERLFQAENHEKPLSERAPVEPAGAALLERSDSGTVSVPLFTVSSEVRIEDFVDGESKVAAMTNSSPAMQIATVRSPLENPERRNKNLQWLRLHFRSLSDERNASDTTTDPPPTPAMAPGTRSSYNRAVSFQTLDDAFAASGVTTPHGHKRSSCIGVEEADDGPAAKKAKNLKPRIEYYPRIMVSLHWQSDVIVSRYPVI